MGLRWLSCAWMILSIVVIMGHSEIPMARSQLSPSFYAKSCPSLASIVSNLVKQAVKQDPRMAASLLRLHFHDCFVLGCDASVLLDDTATFQGEKTAFPNRNSLRGFEVIDTIKAAVEEACPKTVSCADILTIAARDSVVAVSGPSWTVPLGRRDGTTASASAANANLPAPTDTLATIISKFKAVGLKELDVASLSGGHTIGRSQCSNVSPRLYNFTNTGGSDPTIKESFLASLKSICPLNGVGTTLVSLDKLTKDVFDNKYYINILNNEGLLQSDQELYSTTGASTIAYVKLFAASQSSFFVSFGASMVSMGNIGPLMGTMGQIRTNCRAINA